MDAIKFRQQDYALLLIWVRAGNNRNAALGCAEIVRQVRHTSGDVNKPQASSLNCYAPARLWVVVAAGHPFARRRRSSIVALHYAERACRAQGTQYWPVQRIGGKLSTNERG
jgi:hypothetical protein